MRTGEETPEINIAIFKLIWKRLIGPVVDPLELKTLLSELIENSMALGIDDVYKMTPQKLGYIVKHKLYLDTARTGGGLRILVDIEKMIELASDLGIREYIQADLQTLTDTNRLTPIPGMSEKNKKETNKKKVLDKVELKNINI